MKIVRTDNSKRIKDTFKKIQSKEIAVGIFEGKTYDDGTPVAYVAAIHEYGYPQKNIPARSFFRPTAEQKKASGESRLLVLLNRSLLGTWIFKMRLKVLAEWRLVTLLKPYRKLTRRH